MPHQDGNWSSWSNWSTCDRDCDGGMQWRHRSCDDPEPIGSGQDCPEHPVEGKQCNTHSCYGEWSCWSPYSSCSVTCGSGIRTRTRKCASPAHDLEILYGCVGNVSQTEICEMPTCEDSIIGGLWSEWSECSKGSVQYRHRVCENGQLWSDCDKTIQMRPCSIINVKIAEASVGASVAASRQLTRHLGGVYLVIVAIVAFIIGGIASVGLYMYIQRYRDQKHKEDELWRNSKNEFNQKQINTISSSQISLDFQNLNPTLPPNNQFSLNTFGSLKKDKMTVNEASTLKRNSMWTNLSISDL